MDIKIKEVPGLNKTGMVNSVKAIAGAAICKYLAWWSSITTICSLAVFGRADCDHSAAFIYFI